MWGLARARDAEVLLRIEDHDATRCRPGFEASIREDLAWLGFVADREVPRQSERGARYAAALAGLEGRGDAYPCTCSRKEIAATIGGDAFNEESRYPGTCREARRDASATPARRVRMHEGAERFTDLAFGEQAQSPADQCGDVLVRDRLGNWTYQFAVAVDDFDQGVTLIIRGADLLTSTGRQVRLGRMLGRTDVPAFFHHPLVLRPDGAKLSKSAGDTGVRELRDAGWAAAEVIGEAAHRCGLQATRSPMAASAAAELFAPHE